MLAAALLVPGGRLHAQMYPRWFLDVPCSRAAAGVANPSFYPDSSVAQAVKAGHEAWVRQQWTRVSGAQEFWSTEAGTFWMGAEFVERYDTAGIAHAAGALRVLDQYVGPSITAVLLGPSQCTLTEEDRGRVSLAGQPPPSWTESPPAERDVVFAVGVAPLYFYESSSWAEAERVARRNLARSVHVATSGLQKVSGEGQELRTEEYSVDLQNFAVVSRWRDARKGIVYVLVRMGG